MNILRLEKTLEVTKSNFPHSLQILPAPPQMIELCFNTKLSEIILPYPYGSPLHCCEKAQLCDDCETAFPMLY